MDEEQKASLIGIFEGRASLHKISPFTWVGTAAMGGLRNRVVPPEFWSADVEEDGTTVAIVACPCGHEPRVPELKILACECERFYFHAVESLWALNGPAPPPPDASLPED